MREGDSDAELVRRLRDADGAALSELYQRFGRHCYALARRICTDDRLAEDVVHEVFQALWRAPRNFDPSRESFATWLLTLVHHKSVDVVRSSGSAGRRPVTGPDPDQEWSSVGTDRAPTSRAAAGEVRAALDRLPDEQRQVLAGAYFGGLTLREIAAFTGVPQDTVKSRMLAGVQQLRSLLAGRLGPDALVAEARAIWKVS